MRPKPLMPTRTVTAGPPRRSGLVARCCCARTYRAAPTGRGPGRSAPSLSASSTQPSVRADDRSAASTRATGTRSASPATSGSSSSGLGRAVRDGRSEGRHRAVRPRPRHQRLRPLPADAVRPGEQPGRRQRQPHLRQRPLVGDEHRRAAVGQQRPGHARTVGQDVDRQDRGGGGRRDDVAAPAAQQVDELGRGGRPSRPAPHGHLLRRAPPGQRPCYQRRPARVPRLQRHDRGDVALRRRGPRGAQQVGVPRRGVGQQDGGAGREQVGQGVGERRGRGQDDGAHAAASDRTASRPA